MNLESKITIATNLAVLIGLGLVVFELQQNREAIHLDHQMALAQTMVEIHSTIATDDELASLVTRANSGDVESLNEAEHLRLYYWLWLNIEPRIGYYNLRDTDFMIVEDWCNLMGEFSGYYNHDYFGDILRKSIVYANQIEAAIQDRCT